MFNLAQIYRVTNAAAGRGSANNSLIMESSPEFLVWTNRNLKYIFNRMFEIAIDLPISMKEEFEKMEILDEKMLLSTVDGLAKDLRNPGLKYYDFNQFEYKLPYEFLYEEWFVANIFGKSSAKIDRRKFIKKLASKPKLDFVFNAFDLRAKFKQT